MILFKCLVTTKMMYFMCSEVWLLFYDFRIFWMLVCFVESIFSLLLHDIAITKLCIMKIIIDNRTR